MADSSSHPVSELKTFHDHVRHGRLADVVAMVKRGINVNAGGTWGLTALALAVHCGHIDVVRYLLSKGAMTNTEDKIGATPLHAAAYTSDAMMLQVLVDAGGNVNAVDKEGWTPLVTLVVSPKLETADKPECLTILFSRPELDLTLGKYEGMTADSEEYARSLGYVAIADAIHAEVHNVVCNAMCSVKQGPNRGVLL
jgi:Ankyrin repeats (3 copies)